MRKASGNSLKSSFSHTFIHDTRDDNLMGTRGLYMKVFREVAGLGGDAKFHKFEAEGQLSRSLFPGTVSTPSTLLCFTYMANNLEVGVTYCASWAHP